ncbi:MAG: oligosaccharide flippase family protein [Gemmatimonadota bacterium]
MTSTPPQSLSTRAARGVLWSGGSIALQVAVTVLFFRFLPPEVMGQFQAALLAVVLVALVGDLGLGTALVQARQVDEEHFDAAFWTALICGLVLVGASVAAAGWLAGFNEDAAAFERAFVPLSCLLPFAAVSGVVRARLQRALRFGAHAVVDVSASVVAAGVGVAVLAAGGGIWSPIANAVSREVAQLAALLVATHWLPRLRLRPALLRGLLPFGLHITGANLLNYLISNLDYAFVLRGLGYRALGYYSFAYRCTMQPYTRVATAIARVTFPTFASIQDDVALLRRAYLGSTASIALIAWPLLMGMLVFAGPLTAAVRPELLPGVRAFELLTLASLLKAVGTVAGSVFLARGKAHWAFRWTLFCLALLVPGLYLGVAHGVAGVAAAVLVLSAVFLIASQALVNRLIGLCFATYARALARPLAVALWVLAAMLACRAAGPAEPMAALLLAAAVGPLAYGLGLRLFAARLCCEAWASLRGARPVPEEMP